MLKHFLFLLTGLFIFLSAFSEEGEANFPAKELSKFCRHEIVNNDRQPKFENAENPSYFYISKEETESTNIFELKRYQFIAIHHSQLVPQNFSFKKDISYTAVLIDYKMPVPIYIKGHVLRH